MTSQGAKWISRFAVLSAYSLKFTKLHPGEQEDKAGASKAKHDIKCDVDPEVMLQAYAENDQGSKGSLTMCASLGMPARECMLWTRWDLIAVCCLALILCGTH